MCIENVNYNHVVYAPKRKISQIYKDNAGRRGIWHTKKLPTQFTIQRLLLFTEKDFREKLKFKCTAFSNWFKRFIRNVQIR